MAGEITGLKELSSKLEKMGAVLGGKVLRQATVLATSPVIKQMKAAMPVGSVEHKTFKGRLVAPGFARRSIKRVGKLKKGVATVTIGVKSEAFYAVSFIDRGTKTMRARPWFKNIFIRNRAVMERRMVTILKKKIEQVAAKKR